MILGSRANPIDLTTEVIDLTTEVIDLTTEVIDEIDLTTTRDLEYEDYYEILDLDCTATQSDITKAYRRLALVMHPDKNPEERESARYYFQFVVEAYEVLSNPESRAQYDSQRK